MQKVIDVSGFIKQAQAEADRRGVTVEQLKSFANMHAQLFGADGQLKTERHARNLVVTAGLNFIADQLSTTPGGTKMTHMAVGTGAGAAAAGDTALTTENDRNAVTSLTDSGAVLTAVGTWAAGDATAALTEAGVFNAASVGTMLARVLFSVINKGASDTLVITWTFTFAAA